MKGLINKYKLQLLKKLIQESTEPADNSLFQELRVTKYDEPVLIRCNKDPDIPSRVYQLISINKLKADSSFLKLTLNPDHLSIGDVAVLGSQIGKGYGSLLMEYAFSEAHQRNYKYICGRLAGDQLGQRARQINYYSHFGFIIDGDYIRKDL